jgi:hypothetical protein
VWGVDKITELSTFQTLKKWTKTADFFSVQKKKSGPQAGEAWAKF